MTTDHRVYRRHRDHPGYGLCDRCGIEDTMHQLDADWFVCGPCLRQLDSEQRTMINDQHAEAER